MGKHIEQLFLELKNGLAVEYGITNGITKIGLEPKLFDAVMVDLYKRHNHSFASMAEPQIVGIEVVPRVKDKF